MASGNSTTAMEYSQALPVPSAIKVSMLALCLRSAAQAPRKK